MEEDSIKRNLRGERRGGFGELIALISDSTQKNQKSDAHSGFDVSVGEKLYGYRPGSRRQDLNRERVTLFTRSLIKVST